MLRTSPSSLLRLRVLLADDVEGAPVDRKLAGLGARTDLLVNTMLPAPPLVFHSLLVLFILRCISADQLDTDVLCTGSREV